MKNFIIIIILLLFQQFITHTGFSQNNGNNILNIEQEIQGRELYNSSSEKPRSQIEKIAHKTLGQLAVSPYLISGYTPTTLIQNVLVSGCLVASNITFTGNNASLGSFNSNGSSFPINNGIIISTGNVTNAIGPNQFTNATTQFTTPGDADLNVITGSNSTKDAAVLEFDFVPANNTIEFRYIFASEEYPEWACGTFNDVFAFLLSGPGINGGQGFSNNAKNIALLPNNITPVTINNIHIGGWNQGNSETSHNPLTCPDINSQYYISNAGSTSIEYDGMTTVLTAHWTVIPCQTYHIKFAIADVADRKWDSGVFIEGASFTSNPVTMDNFDNNGNPSIDVFEGCNNNFVFSRNNLINSSPLTIHYTVTGSADSLDHNFPSDSVTIPAGIDSLIVPYSILSDGVFEGNESLTVSIGNGCPCSANSILKTLILHDALALTTNYNGITCKGLNNGVIVANASGGSGSYQYSINGGAYQISNMFSNLGPGIYSVTINDGASCSTISDTIILNDPPSLNINASITTNILCYNESNAVITVIANGGSGGYQYNFNGEPNQVSGIFNNLAAGNYIMSVIDTNGCVKQDTVIITQPPQLNSSIIVSNDASCNRFFDGSATVSVSGGTPSYSYLWSNGCLLQNNNYLSADTYFVTITDNNGCISTDSIVIDEPALLTATITNIVNVSCNGGNSGSATVIGGGGTAPYSYLWSTGDTNTTITGLSAGIYNVTVTDDHGCVILATVTILEPLLIMPNISVISQVNCYSGSNGSVSISSTGGIPSYSYHWSNGSTQTTLTGLSAGTYFVTITDNIGCTVSTSVTINQPPLLTTSISPTNIGCFNQNNGSATASASGGTTPYNYLWSTGSTSNSINNLMIGTYTITVTDLNGCTASASITITQPTILTTSIIPPTNVTCFAGSNGSATIVPNGGTSPYSYNWSNGTNNATASGLITGTYNVTVTDNHGCTATNSVIINQPPKIITNISSITNVSCNGSSNGSAMVTANGGVPPYTYTWSNGSHAPAITNLISGTYTVTVTDNNGCTASNSVTITQPPILQATVISNNVSCNSGSNGSATASATGGTPPYSYHWSNGNNSNIINNLLIGSYSVTVTDLNGCTTTASITITQPTVLTTSITPPTNVACFAGSNGSATVVPNGGTSPYSYNWSNGTHNGTASGLVTGTYTVTVTDNNGCSSTNSVVINQPPQLITSIASTTNILCNGGSNGSATISATGGVPAYSYIWSNGSNNITISNLVAGTYKVTITDNNGCTATNSVTITQPNKLIATITSSNVSCFGGNNGTANVTVTGGTPVYNYNWSNGNNTNSISNINAGTYSVTVTDANGCTATATKTITQPVILTTIINPPINATCYNANNGSATVIPSGGTSPYFYNWSNGNTNASASGLLSGTYTVTVTDNRGCTATNSVFVNQPPQLISTITSTTTVSCNGGNNGIATVVASGGIAPYSYLWSNGNSSTINSNLTAGIYTVTVTDYNGCTSVSNATINQSTLLVASIQSLNGISCYGGNNGIATVTASGGNLPYSYSWSNGVNNAINNNLVAGTYFVTVTDNTGCNAFTTATITQPDSLIPNITSSNISCFGGNNGSATVNPVGGTPSYIYIWSTGNNSQAINNLASGNYSVTVTDNNGCSATNTVNLIQPPIAINITSTTTDISCFGANNGSAQIFVTGNTGPYSYVWSNAATTDTINGLPAGNYTVSVTDSFGCVLSASVFINEPLLLTTNMNIINNVSCNSGSDGMAEVVVNGGTQTYTYQWSNGSLSSVISGLTAANYNVTVTDINGCTSSNTLTITEPNLLTSGITAFSNVSCANGSNGSALVNCSGGMIPYSYVWSNGNTTNVNNNIIAGSYSVTATDDNGCTTTSSVIISEPTPINAVITVNNQVSCFNGNDGSATVNVSGGVGPYSFVWSNGSVLQTNNNLTAGQYNLTVTDQNFCQAFESVIITQPSQSIFITMSSTDVSCATGSNGSANALVGGSTGPYSYIWSNNVTFPSISNLTAGNYSLTVTDAMGCFMTSQVTINEPLVIALQISLSNVSCFNGTNGSASVSVAGGTSPYTYSWSNGSIAQTLNGIVAGSYFVTVIDQLGCTDTASAIITQPTLLTAVISSTNVSCFGGNNGSATVLVSGGTMPYYYLWSNADNNSTAGALIAGNYTVTVTDANLCNVFGSAMITQPSQLSSQITSSKNATCFGYFDGSASVAASGGIQPYHYQWDVSGDTSSTTNSLGAGVHNVVITDINGCTSFSTVNISQPSKVIITTYGDTIVCSGNLTTIGASASGGTVPYTYNWDPASGNTNSLFVVVWDSINYTVYATDSNGCTSDTGLIVLTTNPKLTATISGDSSICIGESTNLYLNINGGIGPYSYIWNNGLANQTSPITVSPTSTTTYNVTVFDACNSLPAIASFTVTVHPMPVANVSVDNMKGCGSLNANFIDSNYVNNNTYLWDFGDPRSGTDNYSDESNPSHFYGQTGIYDLSLTVTSQFGCKSVFSYPQFISVFDIPVAAFDLDNLIYSLDNPTVRFKNQSTGGDIWLWDFDEPSSGVLNNSTAKNPYHIYSEMGDYTIWLYVENEYGCIDSTSREIHVLDYITFYVPTAFTPNGDGSNDEFMIQGTGLQADGFSILIYDRWGELVFESNDILETWNGKIKNRNKICPNGVYTWIVSAKDELGGQINKTGSITIIH
jgi:gliding motility-associated-like protein